MPRRSKGPSPRGVVVVLPMGNRRRCGHSGDMVSRPMIPATTKTRAASPTVDPRARVDAMSDGDAVQVDPRGGMSRRKLLAVVPAVAPLVVVGLASGSSGCAAVIGEEDVDAYFKLKPDSDGNFFGWSEIMISGADPAEDDAEILQALLEAVDGTTDLSFIQSIVAEAVTPEARTALAEGGDFPGGESIVPLDLVHQGGIAQFFTDAGDGDSKIRIEWTGKADPTLTYPADGYRVNVRIKVEVL